MAWACPLEQVFVFAAARLRLSLSGREVKCYCISHCLFVWLGCSWALLGPESPLCRCLCVCLRGSWAHFGPRTPQARPICMYALAVLCCACVYASIFMWCMRVCMCMYACMHVAYAWCMCVCVYACCVCGCSVVLLDPESPVHVCMRCVFVGARWSFWTPGHPLCAGLSKPPI
jgi:hypothetical protein